MAPDVARGCNYVLQIGRAVFIGRRTHRDELHFAVQRALGKIGGRDAKLQLEELTHHEDEAVREMAAESLEDLSQASGLLSGEIEAPELVHPEQEEPDEGAEWDDETYAG